MKYVTILCDGMSDYPVDELGGKTPMEAAFTPHMDALCRSAIVGLAKTVPDGMSPGSDIANLSVLGYDPARYYTGRSPLEALSIGVDLADEDMAFRCNLVTMSDSEAFEDKTITDYCAGDISTAEAAQLIDYLKENLKRDGFCFYAGVSYRHCLIARGVALPSADFTPPHDITGRCIGGFLPPEPFLGMMKESYALLKEHPVNQRRVSAGKRPANCIWLWGQGSRPNLDLFAKKFGRAGAIVSAVDLLKGIGKGAGMKTPAVPGATGYLDTNFEGKVAAAVDALQNGCDFVYIHIEAPDECGHRFEIDGKVLAIEEIDRRVVGPLVDTLEQMGDYRVLICPDHATPLATKTHASDPVPFLIYDSTKTHDGADVFTEASVREGVFLENGYELMELLLDDC